MDVPAEEHSQATDEAVSQKRRFYINRAFALLWTGQTISEFGSRITREGLPLAANLVLGATALQMGLLAAFGMLPVLLVSLLAGAWVDRVRRRPILIMTDISRALLLLSVPVAALLGVLRIEQLYVVTALVGALTVFFEVAHQSFLPTIVRREHIVEGNSKLSASSSLAEVGGPALAGVLVQAITAPFAILFDALSFLASALCIGLMRDPEPAPVAERQRLWRDMRAGLHMVLGRPVLRSLALSSSTRSFCGGAFAALYGLYVIRVLQVTPALFGVLVAMGGVGALLGAFIARPLVRRCGIGPVLIGSMLLSSALMLLTPLASGPQIIVALMLMLSQLLGDCAYEIYIIHSTSLLQMLVPDRSLGRASASMQFLVGGMLPLGALLAGTVAEAIGMRATLLIASLLAFALSSAWLIFSSVRGLRHLDFQSPQADRHSVSARPFTP